MWLVVRFCWTALIQPGNPALKGRETKLQQEEKICLKASSWLKEHLGQRKPVGGWGDEGPLGGLGHLSDS